MIQYLEKFAAELQEHQKRVLNKLDKTNELLVYHGTGAGKTLTALSAAEKYKKPLTVIGPASLRTNFDKEKAKHKIKADVDTYTYNKPPIQPKGILVFDEAHKVGRAGTQRSQYPDYIKGDKTIFATATPLRNSPDELIPIMRGLGIKINKDPAQFNEKYIQQIKQNPGFFARIFKGVEPGITYKAKNLDILKKQLKGKVDYYKPKDSADYPKAKEYDIKVEMTKEQEAAYDMASKRHPSLMYKVRKGIAPSKAESNNMNAFLTATRQISNAPLGFNLSSSLADAPKINRAVKEIEKRYATDKNYKGVTYSAYIEHGVNPLEHLLKKKGIPHAKFTGDTKRSDREQAVKDYNAGKIKHLLISGAGGEGLDLKGTKLMQILEPHWNRPVVDQVRGRAVRFKSHAHLPEAEREVEVQNFIATPREKGFIFKNRPMGTDEYLQMLSKNKKDLNDQFLNMLKEVGGK